jgi:hypothetical protein|tara:strand:- start:2656 stop:3348 length:693 start_codon:yes stop_codon:yes gene_type:complete
MTPDEATEAVLLEMSKVAAKHGVNSEAVNNFISMNKQSLIEKINDVVVSNNAKKTCDYSGLVNDFANKMEKFRHGVSADNFAEIDNAIANMYLLLDTYRSVYDKYYNRIIELSDTRNSENKKLIKNVDNSNKLVNTNKRKVVYEKRQFEGLQTYRSVLLIAFYLLLVIYFIYGNFFSSRLYRVRLFMYIFVPLCVSPLIINYFVRFLYFLMRKINHFLNNRAPKNVYVNI